MLVLLLFFTFLKHELNSGYKMKYYMNIKPIINIIIAAQKFKLAYQNLQVI